MAQTKKQRFRAEKRLKKATATKSSSSGSKKKRLIMGGVAVAAVGGIVAGVMVFANPFASHSNTSASPANQTSKPAPAPSLTPQHMNAPFARITLLKDYQITAVTPEFIDQIVSSCDKGTEASGPGRIRGKEIQISVKCAGTKLTVLDATTKQAIPSAH